MKEDYTKYLSYDNGKGLLIAPHDKVILDRYKINYQNIYTLSDLITIIENIADETEDEELEIVLEHLNETHYYQEIKK